MYSTESQYILKPDSQECLDKNKGMELCQTKKLLHCKRN